MEPLGWSRRFGAFLPDLSTPPTGDPWGAHTDFLTQALRNSDCKNRLRKTRRWLGFRRPVSHVCSTILDLWQVCTSVPHSESENDDDTWTTNLKGLLRTRKLEVLYRFGDSLGVFTHSQDLTHDSLQLKGTKQNQHREKVQGGKVQRKPGTTFQEVPSCGVTQAAHNSSKIKS